jgi:shikimate kinase
LKTPKHRAVSAANLIIPSQSTAAAFTLPPFAFMQDKAWILVGMMGAGKTTVGRILSERTGRVFRDVDRMLVNRLGRPIPQLFSIYGEETFREHETAILKSLEPEASIVSTGGGIVLRPVNWEIMRTLGTVIYLKAPLEVLMERLAASKKKRPLLQVEDPEERVKSILEARKPLYEQADVIIELGDSDAEGGATLVMEAMEAR